MRTADARPQLSHFTLLMLSFGIGALGCTQHSETPTSSAHLPANLEEALGTSLPRSQTETSPGTSRQIIFAGLSSTPPRFIDAGPNRGTGWQEYETLEIRKALRRAGFEIKMEYMTPARIEHEFQAKNPICTWPVKWKDPKAVFTKKPDRVYSIPLSFEGDEVHSVYYRKVDDQRFKKHRDEKGDLKLDSLLSDSSLKTLFVRDADYGSLNPKLFSKNEKGDQVVRSEFRRNVMTLLIRDNQQLLEMLNGGRFDYIVADSVEDQDFKKTGISKESINKTTVEVHRVTSIQDPNLVLVSVACSDHPTAQAALPVINRQIDGIRGWQWTGKKLNYQRLTNGKPAEDDLIAASSTTVFGLRGAFESGQADTWYPQQQKHFPGLKLIAEAPEIKGDRLPSPLDLAKRSLQWYANTESPDTVLLLNSASLPWNLFRRRASQARAQGMLARIFHSPEDLLARDLPMFNTPKPTQGTKKFEDLLSEGIKSWTDQKKFILFATGLSKQDLIQLTSERFLPRMRALTDLTVVGAGQETAEALVKMLSPNLIHLSFLSCELDSAPIGDAIKNLSNLKTLRLTNSQIGFEQTRTLLRALPSSLLSLSLGYNRHAFLRDSAETLRSVKWPNLQELDLESDWLSDAHLEALKAALPLTVKRLSLSHNEFSPLGLRSFLQRPFPNLVQLELSGSAVGSNLPHRLVIPPTVRTLELAEARLNPENIQRIIFPPQLQALDLSFNDLSDHALRSVAPSLLGQMDFLKLKGAHATEQSLVILLKSKLREVEALDFSQNGLEDRSVQLLTDGNLKVTNLDLSSNFIHSTGAKVLAGKFAQQLRSISLTGNPITEEGFCALVQGLPPTLESFESNGVLGIDVGCLVQFLEKGRPANSLRELRVGENGLGDAEIASLVKALPPSLVALDLSDSEVLKAGYDAMQSLNLPELRWINFTGISLSEGQLAQLLSSLSGSLNQIRLGPIQPLQSDGNEKSVQLSLRELFPGLRRLHVLGVRIDRNPSQLLRQLPPDLRMLEIGKIQGEVGMPQTFDESNLKHLRQIEIGANVWGDLAREALQKSLGPSLEHYYAAGVGITDHDLSLMVQQSLPNLYLFSARNGLFHSRALIELVKRTHLRSIVVNLNLGIDSSFFEKLSREDLESLRFINMAGTDVSSAGWVDGFKKLSSEIVWISMSNNKIQPRDVSGLIKVLPKHFFYSLAIRGLPIGENSRRELRQAVDAHEARTGIRIEIWE